MTHLKFIFKITGLVFFSLIFSCGNTFDKKTPTKEAIGADSAIEYLVALMDRQSYDSALSQAGTIYAVPYEKLSPKYKYILHCLESEILYYNALFQLGAEKAEQALIIAQNDLKKDPLYVSNAHNLIGINTENFLNH